MLALQIIYTISGIVAIAAGLPQMIRLIKAKNSHEFSVQTWAIWMCTQMVSAAYLSTLGNPLVLLLCLTWVAFYASMVVLIIRYAPRKELATAPIE